jgi:hypothetical protein
MKSMLLDQRTAAGGFSTPAPTKATLAFAPLSGASLSMAP